MSGCTSKFYPYALINKLGPKKPGDRRRICCCLRKQNKLLGGGCIKPGCWRLIGGGDEQLKKVSRTKYIFSNEAGIIKFNSSCKKGVFILEGVVEGTVTRISSTRVKLKYISTGAIFFAKWIGKRCPPQARGSIRSLFRRH